MDRKEEPIRLRVFDEDGVSTLVKATTTEFEEKKSYISSHVITTQTSTRARFKWMNAKRGKKMTDRRELLQYEGKRTDFEMNMPSGRSRFDWRKRLKNKERMDAGRDEEMKERNGCENEERRVSQ